MSKPKGSAAVLQKVFGEDAGAKAAQNLQKATQISLPKVPASAKVPGRITESEQLRCAPPTLYKKVWTYSDHFETRTNVPLNHGWRNFRTHNRTDSLRNDIFYGW